MAEKRERILSSPTGRTPTQRPKRQLLRLGAENRPVVRKLRTLALTNEAVATVATRAPSPAPEPSLATCGPSTWTDRETIALLEFLLFHRPSDKWPSTKDTQFWKSAAEFVEVKGKGRMRRSGVFVTYIYLLAMIFYSYLATYDFSGQACRTRATFGLGRHFSSPLEALQHYNKPVQFRPKKGSPIRLHKRDASTQTDPAEEESLQSCMLKLPESDRLPAITKLLQVFSTQCATDIPVAIPDDFLSLTLKAMSYVKKTGRYNVLYGLARGLDEMRKDGSDSKIPALRMPMGLLEYIISFYNSETINEVGDK